MSLIVDGICVLVGAVAAVYGLLKLKGVKAAVASTAAKAVNDAVAQQDKPSDPPA